MAVLQIPDEQVAALKARAEAVGMTLEAWLAALAVADSPSQRPQRFKLEALIAQCDLDAPLTDEDRDWLDAPLVGRELL